jgi:hypothetical protein
MANDSGFAAMAALIVDMVKLFEDEGFQTALAECPRGGRPHRSSAKHDDVEVAWF